MFSPLYLNNNSTTPLGKRKSELLFLSFSLMLFYFLFIYLFICVNCFLGYLSSPVSLAPQAGKLPAIREMLGLGLRWGLWVVPSPGPAPSLTFLRRKSSTSFLSAQISACQVWTRKELPHDFLQWLPLLPQDSCFHRSNSGLCIIFHSVELTQLGQKKSMLHTHLFM